MYTKLSFVAGQHDLGMKSNFLYLRQTSTQRPSRGQRHFQRVGSLWWPQWWLHWPLQHWLSARRPTDSSRGQPLMEHVQPGKIVAIPPSITRILAEQRGAITGTKSDDDRGVASPSASCRCLLEHSLLSSCWCASRPHLSHRRTPSQTHWTPQAASTAAAAVRHCLLVPAVDVSFVSSDSFDVYWLYLSIKYFSQLLFILQRPASILRWSSYMTNVL